MSLGHLTDKEVALHIAQRLRAWRVDPDAAGMTLDELSRRSGMGLTPLKRFEKTGGITLRNLIALMRAMGLLDRLEELVPASEGPSPLDLLEAEQSNPARKRAPRRQNAGAEAKHG
jgi:hypothetical protein